MTPSNGDVRMRRISQSEPFQLNHFAGKCMALLTVITHRTEGFTSLCDQMDVSNA